MKVEFNYLIIEPPDLLILHLISSIKLESLENKLPVKRRHTRIYFIICALYDRKTLLKVQSCNQR